jgi:ferredoxin
MALQILEELCTACGDCEPVCPTNSIQNIRGSYRIDTATCTECEDEADLPQCLETCLQDDCIVAA